MIDTELIGRVERAIREIQAGRMVILVDDEDRENEGDLCMAAEKATAEAITFMATQACGLICLALTPERVDRLRLPMMVRDNQSRFGTAFTVSIEAREGVSTGISAADRAVTIRTAVDRSRGPEDIVSPGHVFPLRSAPGGVLQRAGQTEGSVDLARLAGLDPSGVICEIMRSDGTMARLPDLEKFAAKHQLLILTIADLIAYRLSKERLVRRVAEERIRLDRSGRQLEATAYLYEAVHDVEDRRYLALVIGNLKNGGPPLVRVHTGCLLSDVFGIPYIDQHISIESALKAIGREGRGVLLYLPPQTGMSKDEITAHRLDASQDPHHHDTRLREFGLGAQVLADLGVTKLRLLTGSPLTMFGLKGFGLEVVAQIACEEETT